jgi:hypothetical protein
MFVIGNNCCAAYLYQKIGVQFNHPFVWMVLSNLSIYNLLEHWYDIDWTNINLRESSERAGTYILNVDGLVDIHYVHYRLNLNKPTLEVMRPKNSHEAVGSHIEWNQIYKYVVSKYISRTARMLKLSEPPCFLIKQESYANNNMMVDLSSIAQHQSNFKRYIITTDTNLENDPQRTRIQCVNHIGMPIETVNQYYNDIRTWFAL